jgi:hypothetical protein
MWASVLSIRTEATAAPFNSLYLRAFCAFSRRTPPGKSGLDKRRELSLAFLQKGFAIFEDPGTKSIDPFSDPIWTFIE